MTSKPPDPDSAPASLVGDPSKGMNLFLGMMLVLASCSLAESIKMLYTGSRASLLELIIFTLLAVDAVVLLLTIRYKREGPPGLLRYLGVWILGLIPYFGWLAVYWLGERIAKVTQGQGKARAIALILFIGIMVLCLGIYFFASAPVVTTFPSQP